MLLIDTDAAFTILKDHGELQANDTNIEAKSVIVLNNIYIFFPNIYIFFFLRDFIFKKTLFEKNQYLKQKQNLKQEQYILYKHS